METKVCSSCKIEKPISEFYPQKTHKYGVMSMCKNCFNKLCNDRWIKRKKQYISLLGGECTKCHIKFDGNNYAIFDFHHTDPSAKEYNWAKLRLYTDARIKEELAKCQLVCSNCHRLIHSVEM
jgi:predicted HNH restriction endonuclease